MPTGKPNEWASPKEVVEMYSRWGYYPEGQKGLGYDFFSVLWCRNPGKDRWTLTTVDDHTRPRLVDQPLTSFPLDYLINTAGWVL
jgi:hypothetical protein